MRASTPKRTAHAAARTAAGLTLHHAIRRKQAYVERAETYTHSLTKRFHKVRTAVAVHGLAIKIGNAAYPVPPALAAKVFMAITEPGSFIGWKSKDEFNAIASMKFLSKQAERIGRGSQKPPLITRLKYWQTLKRVAGVA